MLIDEHELLHAHILILDDQAANVQLMEQVLSEAGSFTKVSGPVLETLGIQVDALNGES